MCPLEISLLDFHLFSSTSSGSVRGTASASAASARLLLAGLVDDLCCVEIPGLHSALRHAGLPISLPVCRWLSVGWLNVLPWSSLMAALLLPLLCGPDFQVYLCVAAMHSLQAAVQQRCSHPAELHLLLLQPLEDFDVIAAVPLMIRLQREHGPRCLATIATESGGDEPTK